jgi:anti-sigma regulatory factor (Ser/Thr protein kinase)
MPEHAGRRVMFPVKDPTDVILGIQRMRESGLLEGADEVDRSLVATIVSELATNIVKYAQRGLVRVQRVELPDAVDIEVWAEDEGPGIVDIDRARTANFSTGNTLGLGLPGVERMSDAFDIQSVVGHGTQVHARKRIVGRSRHPTRPPAPAGDGSPADLRTPQWDIGMHLRPMHGLVVSGDLTIAIRAGSGLLLLIADGTGHGVAAAEAAQRVAAFARAHADGDLGRFLAGLHAHLHGSVGAAVGALFIDPAARTFRYAGVGNTSAQRRSGAPWRGVSKDGVLGQRLPSPLVQEGTLARGDLLLMHSDGVSETAAGEFARRESHASAAQLARTIVAELGKPHDDASCIVLRWND